MSDQWRELRERLGKNSPVIATATAIAELLRERDRLESDLAASRREVAALREALRKHCIKHAQCAECGKSWMFPFGDDYPEEHEPGCLAALVEGTTVAPTGSDKCE